MKDEKTINEEALEAEETAAPEAATAENEAAAAENAAATAESEAAADEAQTPEERLAAAEARIAELKDQYLRKMADFENLRKRTIKEKTELILNGGKDVIESLLPVLDDLERALDNVDKTDDVAAIKEGIHLIVDKLAKALAAKGLKKMETEGKEFDTDFHEAVTLFPGTPEQKNKIIDCVQTGYFLNERVLRHAKVVVGQ